MCELRLDLDGSAELDPDRLEFLLSTLQDTLAAPPYVYRTRRGHHVVLKLSREYPPVAVVAMQAILGSDPRREIFNVWRALSLESAPEFWRHPGRWNTLYSEKLSYEETGMIDPGKFGSSRPALGVDALGSADAAVWRVSVVEEIDIDQDGASKPKLILTFEEFPENAYWVNVTGIKSLVAKLGNDETKWTGKQVPLVRANTQDPRTHKPMQSLWIASPDEWDDILAQHRGGSRRSRSGVARPAAKKSSAKNAAKKTRGR